MQEIYKVTSTGTIIYRGVTSQELRINLDTISNKSHIQEIKDTLSCASLLLKEYHTLCTVMGDCGSVYYGCINQPITKIPVFKYELYINNQSTSSIIDKLIELYRGNNYIELEGYIKRTVIVLIIFAEKYSSLMYTKEKKQTV